MGPAGEAGRGAEAAADVDQAAESHVYRPQPGLPQLRPARHRTLPALHRLPHGRLPLRPLPHPCPRYMRVSCRSRVRCGEAFADLGRVGRIVEFLSRVRARWAHAPHAAVVREAVLLSVRLWLSLPHAHALAHLLTQPRATRISLIFLCLPILLYNEYMYKAGFVLLRRSSGSMLRFEVLLFIWLICRKRSSAWRRPCSTTGSPDTAKRRRLARC